LPPRGGKGGGGAPLPHSSDIPFWRSTMTFQSFSLLSRAQEHGSALARGMRQSWRYPPPADLVGPKISLYGKHKARAKVIGIQGQEHASNRCFRFPLVGNVGPRLGLRGLVLRLGVRPPPGPSPSRTIPVHRNLTLTWKRRGFKSFALLFGTRESPTKLGRTCSHCQHM